MKSTVVLGHETITHLMLSLLASRSLFSCTSFCRRSRRFSVPLYMLSSSFCDTCKHTPAAA
jgi:hypothetical protein